MECVESNVQLLCECLDRVDKSQLQSYFQALYEAEECRPMQHHFVQLFTKHCRRRDQSGEGSACAVAGDAARARAAEGGGVPLPGD